jgi:hypothetical protein
MREESNVQEGACKLSVIIPCYNEMATLQRCIASVMRIGGDNLTLEIIIVDDCSTDDSFRLQTLLLLDTKESEFCGMQKIWAKGPLSVPEFLKRPAISLRSRTRT